MKAPLFVVFKLVVATALVAWMLHGGALDVGALRVLVDRPELLVASLATIALAVAAVRWRLLQPAGRLAIERGNRLPARYTTIMVPISYVGIGVGRVAFERLFALVGMTGGATEFNVYLVAPTAPCLLGVFPYLTQRRRAAPPPAAEAAS